MIECWNRFHCYHRFLKLNHPKQPRFVTHYITICYFNRNCLPDADWHEFHYLYSLVQGCQGYVSKFGHTKNKGKIWEILWLEIVPAFNRFWHFIFHNMKHWDWNSELFPTKAYLRFLKGCLISVLFWIWISENSAPYVKHVPITFPKSIIFLQKSEH